jgi:hypothetical protein
MTLLSIIARFQCDGCGREIPRLVLDPATENIPNGMAWAEEALKDDLQSSIQAEMHLCEACTTIADHIEDPKDPLNQNYQPTADEINAAIEERS